MHNATRLDDGSISASGYFEGRDHQQASKSMDLLQQEYQRFLTSLLEEGHHSIVNPGSPHTSHEQNMYEDTGGSMSEPRLQVDESEVGEDIANSGRLQVVGVYDGCSMLNISTWHRLVNWLWTTLSEEHMSELQGILYLLRTNQSMMPTVNNSRHSGIAGSQLHIDLVRKYHKVIRSMSTKDISCLTQCFYLVNLFKSHEAYVEEFHKQGIATQTAHQKVNYLLYDVFNSELGTIVSQQMINNHVKEGWHWYEVLHIRETQHFGDGLLLLLPARGYADIARKTADSVWTFLLPQICNISPRIINLAITLQPIAKALQTKGTGHVDVALLRYELRSPTNLHELTRSHFNACLTSYPDLDVKDTLRTIGLLGRTDDPDRILAQARPDSYSRNLDDGLYDSHILQQSGDDVPRIDQRDIESPEGVVQASNNGNLQDDHPDGNDLQEGGDNSIQSDQRDVESVEGVAAISFPRFLILGTNAREDPIHSNNNLNDGIVVGLQSEVAQNREATDSGLMLPLRASIDRPDSHRFTRSKSSSARHGEHRISKPNKSKTHQKLTRMIRIPPTTISQLFQQSSSTDYSGTIPLMFPEFASGSMLQLPLLRIPPQSTSTHFSTGHSGNMEADGDNAYGRIVELESSPEPELDSEDERILCLFDKTPTSHTTSTPHDMIRNSNYG
ncbi:hypothetical protein L873DRAFT_1848079 [Choiromyces venosus 120613-1]|uniref:Uncharacterized protein n=1 Tax=Choiromyces venosus 120613-1 TaxID=1336337 RepID=A0A3N4J0L2_9PEZI|nr:hypothetical protein L873DRAFT_1848079 [Choiromyces venosus 120613-1]